MIEVAAVTYAIIGVAMLEIGLRGLKERPDRLASIRERPSWWFYAAGMIYAAAWPIVLFWVLRGVKASR